MNIKELVLKHESNKKLTKEELKFIVENYTNGKISDKDMTLFLKSVCKKELSLEEICFLTDAMINTGEVIDLSELNKKSVDKHSTGGIGDKVSLIIGPIVASSNLSMPKMSGKGLGYTGGTIDKLESIEGYKTNISHKKFIELLNTVGISIISQTKNIVPADKKIYALRDVTNTVESISLIASSIMSKKIATSVNTIIIDLKVGKGAFMKNVKEATRLAKVLIYIGKHYDRKVVCILTRMDYPLGKNIGNALEVQEVIDYFDGKKDENLDTICKVISTYMIGCAKKIYFDDAYKEVKRILSNDSAKNKFYEWIKLQGGKINKLKISNKKIIIKSPKDGYIKNIDASILGNLSCSLGAGRKKLGDDIDYSVGISLNKNVGDKVKKGEILGTCYYNKKIPNIEKIFLSSFKFSKIKVIKKNIIIKIVK